MILFLVLIGAAITQLVIHHVGFAGDQAERLRAEYLARSGLDYAAHEISCGNWLGVTRPFPIERNLDGGKISIQVSDGAKNTLKVECTGTDNTGTKRKMCMYMSKPDAIENYALCVLNFDTSANKPKSDVKVEIGSGNTATSSVTEDLHTIPQDGMVVTRATGDGGFAGIVPGTTYVVDDHGRQFHIEAYRPSASGRYAIDMRSGTFLFHPSDEGRRVAIFHDYFRVVGTGRNGSAFTLPNAPLKADSERIWSSDGILFTRIAEPPAIQMNYNMNYPTGTVIVSYYDIGKIVRASYSFLGSRITGPIHVNGDIEWSNTNQCFLFKDDGDMITASGKFRYATGGSVSIGTEEKYIENVDGSEDAKKIYCEKQAVVDPPLYNLNWIRKQADTRRGGSGWRIDNSGETESFKLAGVPTEEKYQQALFSAWQSREGAYWSSDKFEPPGTQINLSKLPTGEPENGLIFAEGNVRVSGRIPDGRRITIVSAKNIYIEGSIWKDDDSSSLALIAERNICINLTGMSPVAIGMPGSEFYINALLWARRGTIGVIPGSIPDRSATIVGALSMNEAYSNDEWGKAFVNISTVFDRTLKYPENTPPYLSTVLRIEDSR